MKNVKTKPEMTNINLRLPKELLDILDENAISEHLSRNALIVRQLYESNRNIEDAARP